MPEKGETMRTSLRKINKTYKKFKVQVDNCLCSVPEAARKTEKRRIVEELLYAKKHTAYNAVEFFMLGLPGKTHEEWWDYLPDKAARILLERMNITDHSFNSADKFAVYEAYRPYYGREMVKVAAEADKDAFFALLDEKKELMLKPRYGSLGDDIRIVKAEEVKVRDGFFRQLLRDYPDGAVAEELIRQDESLAMLNPTSVNTLRITTVRLDDRVETESFLRVGKMFSTVDNIAKGGIVCALDEETGTVTRTMDRFGNTVTHHPHTRVPLVGFTVPRFREAVELAKTLAQVLPQFRYMGWDLALTETGWVMVEENAKAGIYCIQQTLGRGIRKDLEQFFSELGQPTDFPGMFDESFRKSIERTEKTAGSADSEILFSILRESLFPRGGFPAVTVSDTLYAEMRHQTVEALPRDLMDGLAMPESLRAEWQKDILKNMGAYTLILREQQAVTELLTANGITPVVLKGTSAGMYYPHPECRTMGDIDLIVPKKAFDTACNILKQNGYEEFRGISRRHFAFRKNGIILELHHHFSGHMKPSEAAFLDSVLEDAIPRAQRQTSGSFFWYSFGYPENGLVLLQHLRSHLASGLGLRQIIDWMMYVNAGMTDERWAEFEPLADRCGNRRLAVIAAGMCVRYLGLPDRYAWCDEAEEEDCRNLMEYVLSKGNLGKKKSGGSSRAISALNVGKGGLFGRLRYEQEAGLAHWIAARRNPWLRPFAWIYGIFYHIRSLKHDNETIKSLLSAFAESKKQKRFIEDLIHGK